MNQIMEVAHALPKHVEVWVGRSRRCPNCKWQSSTVELTLKDFRRSKSS